MPTSVLFCLATSRGRADRIIHDLKRAEFAADEVGLLFVERRTVPDQEHDPRALPASEAAAQSAGPIRGVFGWIAGIGRFAVPGMDAFIAAGPIVTALQDTRNGTAGVPIARGLIRLGLPAAEAERFEQRLKNHDHILISVHVGNPDKILHARTIFAELHAEEICPAAESPAPAKARVSPPHPSR